MNLTWRALNHNMNSFTEEQVLAMLNAERVGERRVTMLQRLHQRYNTLRVARERIELLREATQP